MKPFRPERIYIHEASLNDRITESVLEKFPDVPYDILRHDEGHQLTPHEHLPVSISQGKRILYLRHNRGKFVERCPGTRNTHLCCNYFIASVVVNCHLDCTYCFLQSYLTENCMTVNTNIGDFAEEIGKISSENTGREIRIGTGELADSLAMDEITGFSTELVPLFAEKQNLLLELKTKGNYIENLLDLDPKGRTVIAWSLNPPEIIEREEHKCSTLDERLEAAKRCTEAGYKLAFHFDPIILHDGWEENYRETVERIYNFVDETNVLWISMGVLRFPVHGKTVIEERFPKSEITYAEMIPCADGKLRYLQHVRVDIYKKMLSWIRGFDSKAYVYLCMESPAVWDRVFGSDSTARSCIECF